MGWLSLKPIFIFDFPIKNNFQNRHDHTFYNRRFGQLLKMRLALRPLTARVAREQRQFGFTQSQGLVIGVIVPVYL